jgi:hypothetical protein
MTTKIPNLQCLKPFLKWLFGYLGFRHWNLFDIWILSFEILAINGTTKLIPL